MKSRCNNPKHPSAPWYYHKGIRVCDEWHTDFFAFQSWAMSNGYADDLTIDRIDPDGNYCPENCQWVTLSENSKRSNQTSSKKGIYEVWRVHRWANLIEVVVIGLSCREARALAAAYEAKGHRYCHYINAKPKEMHNVGDRMYGFPGEFIK